MFVSFSKASYSNRQVSYSHKSRARFRWNTSILRLVKVEVVVTREKLSANMSRHADSSKLALSILNRLSTISSLAFLARSGSEPAEGLTRRILTTNFVSSVRERNILVKVSLVSLS